MSSGARGSGQFGLSPVHAGGAAGVPDAKTLGRARTDVGPRNGRADPSARWWKSRTRRRIVQGRRYADGYHGGGNRHSLSDRQLAFGRWRTGVDPNDEEIAEVAGRHRDEAARSHCALCNYRLFEIGRASRSRSAVKARSSLKTCYRKLMNSTERVWGKPNASLRRWPGRQERSSDVSSRSRLEAPKHIWSR